MKIAVFSDIHGNLPALSAVLADIEKLQPDQVICAGDLINPLAWSLEVWQKLRELKIPMIRGNHEDYIVTYFREPSSRICQSVQFRPTQKVARHLGAKVAEELARLPLNLRISGPQGDDVLICHASPSSNTRSYFYGVDDELAQDLNSHDVNVIVAGHIHEPQQRVWKGKTLIVAGSVGLALRGKNEADYAWLEHDGKRWNIQLRSVPYDHEETLRHYRESGWVQQGGPVAWMLYDEFCTGEPRLAPFFQCLRAQGFSPSTEAEWISATRRYLEKLGRWSVVQSLSHFKH